YGRRLDMKPILLFCCILTLAIIAPETNSATVRPPAVAGSFYPADSAQLAALVHKHLDDAGPEENIDGELIALIVPHAGLVYSGPIAAYSYKLLEKAQPKTVILCGPSHRYPFRGISVYGVGVEWRTPLGTVKCNDQLCQQLMSYDPRIAAIPAAHRQEHCLEVQLPYLQTVLSDFTIVPLLMGQPDHETVAMLSDALKSLKADSRTVMIAASDWQHYRPAKEGWPLDSVGMECVKALDADRLESLLGSGKTEACGGGSIVAVLRAAVARGANRVKILKYGDSGDSSGDKSSVVGYVAAAIYKVPDTAAPRSEAPAKEAAYPTATDRATLLKIARQSIEAHLTGKPAPQFEVSDTLKSNGGAFVTLTKDGQLRGCIGYTEAFKPLWQCVSECAVSAAVNDPRFPPVTAPELTSLHIEISVLTPLQRIKSLDDIKVGRDGLMISMGNRRGLLLPQVATEYGWTRDEFLQHTCQKAGLPLDAYRSPNAIIQKFQAIVFDETEH
ncbi:MAG: AmmeMemoRadiSam system protein B, partial [candidate division Zixibacteria bacterium]|nr:AmmeMemoRadiSam system protein B [candidate division Zixibacteria bacterium]